MDRGGYAIYHRSILEGVPVLTAKNLIPRDERVSLSLEEIIKELDGENDDLDIEE